MQWLTQLDRGILEAIQSLRTPWLDAAMPFITDLGKAGFIWIVLASVLLFLPKYRRWGVTLLCALAVQFALGEGILKNLFQRVRPFGIDPSVPLLVTPPVTWSFPSGHTMSSFTAATVAWAANRRLGACAYVLAALIAFSRLYLYVHYPTDVAAGAALGIACGALACAVKRYADRRLKPGR